MSFLRSTVGRKIIMAFTGSLLLGFLLIHLVGNSLIYIGWINAYGERLHSLPPLVWAFRIVMLCVFSVHIFFGITLFIENRAARPAGYAVKRDMSATFSSKTMIWSGLLIAVFLIYHLLHFTLRVTNPDISGSLDTSGRLDVFKMVVFSFRNYLISGFYIAAMIVLGLHLLHGVQSIVQTFGLNSDQTLPTVEKAGTGIALAFFLGYASIPLVILCGFLNYKG
ncbi:MAG TPA: succinate dehydrogenase cytochrome b subunit [Dissulfurispiraceae bacterium]|nr:succinate dehydrogenase cytochrome b subunit [Dissulfurispiraceae bacterium]